MPEVMMAEKLSEKFGIRMGSSSSAPPRRKTGKKRRQMYSHMQKMMEKGGFLLLWMAVGLDLLISILGYPMIGQAVSATIVVVYLLYNVSLKKLVCSFWFTVIDFFFREISVGGETKLEALRDNRAIVFCVAPHVNQFIDPIVVMKVVAEQTQRHVSWMTAAKSMSRPWIGSFARAMKCIPVVRPDDLVKHGKGFITVRGTSVKGHGGTRFTEQADKGTVIKVKLSKTSTASGKVLQVVSDSEMKLAGPMTVQYAKVKATGDMPRSKAYNRAISPLLTTIIFSLSFAGCFVCCYYVFPIRFFMLELMLSLQSGCALTHMIYVFIRDGVLHSAMLGEYVRDSKLISGPGSVDVDQNNKKKQTKDGGDEGGATSPEPSPVSPMDVEADIVEQSSFTLLPYVDQSEMFDQVHEALLAGGTIGIFPEGGTHDNTEVLPLKWGVSSMVLGALAKAPADERLPVISIVPVGLNYFAPHKFRSTVSVDFGDPIQVSEDIVKKYRTGSKEDRAECNKAVIDLVLNGVNACTLQAKDVQTLHLFRALRRLFVPKGQRLSVAHNVALTQGFAYGFDRISQDPRVEKVMRDVSDYSNMLMQYRVRDYQVQRFKDRGGSSSPVEGGDEESFTGVSRTLVMLTLVRFLTVGVLCLLLLPWWLCLAPAGLVGRVISDVQAKKVQKMSVIGTWKVLMATAVIPLLHVGYTMCIWSALGKVWGLGWFFFAPVGGLVAIYATEDSIRIMQSLNGLLLLLRQADVGLKLYEMRERLQEDVTKLQEEQNWLDSLDKKTQKTLHRLEAVQHTE